jgi:hypothetical protein
MSGNSTFTFNRWDDKGVTSEKFDTFEKAYKRAKLFDGPWTVVEDGTVSDPFVPGRSLPLHRIVVRADESYASNP